MSENNKNADVTTNPFPLADADLYRRILEHSVDGIYQTSHTGELVYANHALANLFGYESPSDMKFHIQQVDYDIYRYAEDRRRFVDQLKHAGEVIGFECEMFRKDGVSVWVRQNARALLDGAGELEHIIGTVANMTELKRSEQARQRAEADYRRLFDNAQAGLYRSTASGRLLRVNELFAQLLGFDSAATCTRHYTDIGRQLYADPERRRQLLNQLNAQRRVANQRVRLKRRDGRCIWVLMNAQYVQDPDQEEAVMEGSIFDITDQVRAEDEIRFLAEHDVLTGLPNRARFQSHLEEVYSHWREHGYHDFIVLFLDLDHFKDINDTLGHLVGDALLRSIAERLRQPLNAPYQTFRLGGDEFAIVIDGDLDPAELDTFCGQLGQRIGREITAGDHRLRVTASLGVVRSGQLSLDDEDSVPEAIMRAADLALYDCKHGGRADYRLYHQAMHWRLKNEKVMEQRLADALVRDELVLYFQPVFDSRNQRLLGAEALLRWPDADRAGEPVSPAHFIPLAERCGLIGQIDEWVLRRVLTHCEQIRECHPDLVISFNLSAHHFNVDTFEALLEPLTAPIQRCAPNLALELTERVMFENTDRVIDSLNRLRRLGMTISIDDFGTGYSSLSYLTQFPVDKIKIDQSFIRDMLDNTTAMAVVQAAAQIGKTLRLKINAEGIETRGQLDLVRALGIDEAQGFLLGRPLPLEDWLALVAQEATG